MRPLWWGPPAAALWRLWLGWMVLCGGCGAEESVGIEVSGETADDLEAALNVVNTLIQTGVERDAPGSEVGPYAYVAQRTSVCLRM